VSRRKIEYKNKTPKRHNLNFKHTISDEEVFTSASNFNGLASVSETVRLLVVDEDVGSALALEPGLQHGLVLSIRE
jgi:hypothetical protein